MAVAITKIRYRDIANAEDKARSDIANRLAQLAAIKHNRRSLSDAEAKEQHRLQEISDLINDPELGEVCDPLFVTVRDMFNGNPGLLSGYLDNHEGGILRGGTIRPGAGSFTVESCCTAALTTGLLLVDGGAVSAPPVTLRDGSAGIFDVAKPEDVKKGGLPAYKIVADQTAPGWSTLNKMFFAAIGEAQAMHGLALMVLPLLALEGDPVATDRQAGTVDAAEFAKVMRALVADGVTVAEPQLRRRINEALDKIQGVSDDSTVVDLGISLPSLDSAVTSDIVPDHCRLMGVFIAGAMFDELKVFEVVDKLAELFQHGMLAITTGNAGAKLYKYWKDAPNRMSDAERKNFYAMTMGAPGGDTTNMVNREFNDLWLRFVSSVSAFIRQTEVDNLLRSAVPSAISQQQVRKAARDLASNLSAHGYGMAYYAALDLQSQIKFMVGLLGDKDVMSNYGARDMWQVVDQVATLELGGAKTSSRYRTLATCGLIITAWLANNAARIGAATGPFIDINEVRTPSIINNPNATTEPTDYDLVNACELWLADTATSDTTIDQMAQPREAPVMTSRPVQIPAIAREMLADLPGVGMGLSYNTRH
ncbi:MAG: hypothetical protein JF608_03595 [Sphingomonadales bacterium]|nr:hypothetical protein [Sphingomonadales bacterium]